MLSARVWDPKRNPVNNIGGWDSLIAMGGQAAEHLFVRLSGQVIARDDLDQRLRAALADLQQLPPSIGSPDVGTPLTRMESASWRADRLHQHWAPLAPPAVQRQPGVRGRFGYVTKKMIRRLTAWYIEPRWIVQREFDAEAARFSTDVVDAITSLRREIEDLRFTNERLLRRVYAAERALPVSPPAVD